MGAVTNCSQVNVIFLFVSCVQLLLYVRLKSCAIIRTVWQVATVTELKGGKHNVFRKNLCKFVACFCSLCSCDGACIAWNAGKYLEKKWLYCSLCSIYVIMYKHSLNLCMTYLLCVLKHGTVPRTSHVTLVAGPSSQCCLLPPSTTFSHLCSPYSLPPRREKAISVSLCVQYSCLFKTRKPKCSHVYRLLHLSSAYMCWSKKC